MPLQMTFAIWYMRPAWFARGIMGLKPNPKKLTDTHAHLKDLTIPNGDLEQVFVQMQGEHWSPNGEAAGLIKSKGLQHTSMSVGDVVVTGDDTYVVSAFGFTRL